MAKNARKLRDAAQKAADKGKWKKALEAYLELEELEPTDGGWSRRAADCHRRLGDRSEEVVALSRAVDRYSKAGFLVKAIAMCKMILAIDPEHTESQAALAEFSAARGIPMVKKATPTPAPVAAAPAPTPEPAPEPAPPAAPVVSAAPPPPAPPVPASARSIPAGAESLDEIVLNAVVPGSREIRSVAEQPSGVFEIPLEDADLLIEEAIDEIELEAPEAEFDGARATAAELFPRTPLFSELSQESLQRIIGRVGLVELARGELLFRQGDPSDALYVVSEGSVVVIAEGPPRVQLTRLDEGEFFGEIGLMTSAPRRATVEAAEDTQLLRISLDAIGDLVEDEPRVLKVLLRFLRDRLVSHLVATSPLFEPFAGEERATLASRFRFLEVDRDAVLVEQDNRAEGLFVLLSGRAEVVRTVDGESRRLATLDAGDLFGEMSLLTAEPAIATVRTTGKCFALQLPDNVFREIIMTHPQVLMFVGDLADQRRRENAAIIEGSADYAEGHVELV